MYPGVCGFISGEQSNNYSLTSPIKLDEILEIIRFTIPKPTHLPDASPLD